jgi:hypothetical protein
MEDQPLGAAQILIDQHADGPAGVVDQAERRDRPWRQPEPGHQGAENDARRQTAIPGLSVECRVSYRKAIIVSVGVGLLRRQFVKCRRTGSKVSGSDVQRLHKPVSQRAPGFTISVCW